MQGIMAPFTTGEPTAITDLSPAAAASSVDTDTDLPNATVPPNERDNGPWTISGTALGTDVTRSGDETLEWTPEAVERLGPTLADSSQARDYPGDGLLVLDHGEGAADVVGEVTYSGFNADTEEIEYEADLDDPKLARSVRNGRLEVSPRLIHTDPSVLPVNDDGVRTVSGDAAKRAVHLALVQTGESTSNSVTVGPLSAKNPEATDASALRHVSTNDRHGHNHTTTDMSGNQNGGNGGESNDENTDPSEWGASDLAVMMGSDRDDLDNDVSESDLSADDRDEPDDHRSDLSADERRAQDAATLSEILTAEKRDESISDYMRSRGVDPSDYESVSDLRYALNRSRAGGGESR